MLKIDGFRSREVNYDGGNWWKGRLF